MKVRELIEKLEKVENKELDMWIKFALDKEDEKELSNKLERAEDILSGAIAEAYPIASSNSFAEDYSKATQALEYIIEEQKETAFEYDNLIKNLKKLTKEMRKNGSITWAEKVEKIIEGTEKK